MLFQIVGLIGNLDIKHLQLTIKQPFIRLKLL